MDVNWRDKGRCCSCCDDRVHCCKALLVEAKADLEELSAIGVVEIDLGAS